MDSLKDMFEEIVQDIYSGEKQIIKALPKVIKACENQQLKSDLQTHLEQTKAQAEKLEQLAKQLGFKASGKMCKGMQGILEEGAEAISEGSPSPARDAMIIGDCQKVEMYEICNYGTAAAWAGELGLTEAKAVLQQIREEERNANDLLNKSAEGQINREAAQMAATTGKGAQSKTSGTKSTRTAAKTTSPRSKVSVR